MSASSPSPDGVVSAIQDLREYGTVAVGKNGQITLPKSAREELGLSASDYYAVYGSPGLGIVILVGQRRTAAESLLFALRGSKPGSSR